MKKLTLIVMALSVLGVLMAGCSSGEAAKEGGAATAGDAGKEKAGEEK